MSRVNWCRQRVPTPRLRFERARSLPLDDGGAGIAGLEPAASRLTAVRPHPVGLMPKTLVDQPGTAPGFQCLQGIDAAFCLARA